MYSGIIIGYKIIRKKVFNKCPRKFKRLNNSSNLFIAVILQKHFHILWISVKDASSIAFMSTNRSCSSPAHDDTPIVTIVWRCVAPTAANTAIVFVVVTVVGIIKCHSNNTAIAQAWIWTRRPFHFAAYLCLFLSYSFFYRWRNCNFIYTLEFTIIYLRWYILLAYVVQYSKIF